LSARAARAADAVNVTFRVVGQVEIHDKVDAFDVKTASGNVGSH
jgi:hypothetical protein